MKSLNTYINEDNGNSIIIKVKSNDEILNTYLSNFNEFKNGNKYAIKFKHNGEYIEKGYDSSTTTPDIKNAKILSNPKKIQEVLYQFWIHLFNSFRLKDIKHDGPMFELTEV